MAGRVHEVAQGECTSAIAARRGLPWKKIWDAPENEALRETGRQPNVLLPGDQLHLPELDVKAADVATSRRHRVVVSGRKVSVHLTLLAGGEALADEAYIVEYASGTLEGSSDAEGKVELELPATLRAASLLLPDRRLRHELSLGALDPIDTLSGAHARLYNLGLAEGSYDAAREAPTREALRAFQRGAELEPSAELDDDTLAALEDAHGS